MTVAKIEEKVLEYDSRLKPSIVSGCKYTTIRKGHRVFAKHITIAKHPAIVMQQHFYILSTVPLSILVAEGFKSIFDCLRKLQKYYPDININSPVTVIEFRLDVLIESSTHPM